MAPVIFEKYNEITFFEPTENFYPVLVENQYDKYVEREMKKVRPTLNELNEKAVLSEQLLNENFARYINYLSMNGHKPLIIS